MRHAGRCAGVSGGEPGAVAGGHGRSQTVQGPVRRLALAHHLKTGKECAVDNLSDGTGWFMCSSYRVGVDEEGDIVGGGDGGSGGGEEEVEEVHGGGDRREVRNLQLGRAEWGVRFFIRETQKDGADESISGLSNQQTFCTFCCLTQFYLLFFLTPTYAACLSSITTTKYYTAQPLILS